MSKKIKNFKKQEKKFLDKSQGHLPEAGLERLQKEYQSLLPEKLNILNQKLDAVRKTVTRDTLNSLKTEVHDIAQGASTYGYLHVTDICNQFEEEISRKIKDMPKSANEQNWLSDFDHSCKKIKEGFFGKDKK